MQGRSRCHGNRMFVPQIDLAILKELDTAGKPDAFFKSYQGVWIQVLDLIVQVMLEFHTLQGSIHSIPLGWTYRIKSREGVAYRADTCSPLDIASDVLIYVEQLVHADLCITAAEWYGYTQ